MAKVPLSAKPHAFYIRPAPGWLDVLHEEVLSVIQQPLHKYKFEPKIILLKGVVKVARCDWRQGLELLLRLTTAHDIEWLISEFPCTTWSEVEKGIQGIPWKEFLPQGLDKAHVSVQISQGFTQGTAKLRDCFCRISKIAHVSEGASQRFKLELRGEHLRLLISMAGQPLYRRGYKAVLSAVAPLAEHHAAADVRWTLSCTNRSEAIETICVPFAGSGTLGFEALLALSGSGPGAFSRPFACEAFLFNSEATMGFLRKKLSNQLKSFTRISMLWNELNPEALQILKSNIEGFPCPVSHQVIAEDFFEWEPSFPARGRVLILLNPPFGLRLAKGTSPAQFYSRIGKRLRELKESYPTQLLGSCICPDETTWKKFIEGLGTRSVKTHHFTHGGKEMRLVQWDE